MNSQSKGYDDYRYDSEPAWGCIAFLCVLIDVFISLYIVANYQNMVGFIIGYNLGFLLGVLLCIYVPKMYREQKYKNMNIVEYENSLPQKIIFERRVEDAFDGHWTYKLFGMSIKAKEEGVMLRDDLMNKVIDAMKKYR